MIIRDGQKWACRSCITGHRSSKCTHEDRELFPVAKKGRPSSQCQACNHGRASTSTLPLGVKCTCAAKRRVKPRSKSPNEDTSADAAPTTPALGPDTDAHASQYSKRQRYSTDSSMTSDGSAGFSAPGWPSSSTFSSHDGHQGGSTGSSVNSSPVSGHKTAPSSATYPYAPPHIPSSYHASSLPNTASDYQYSQAEVQAQYMRFHSLEAPQSSSEQWPTGYGSAPYLPPPLPPSAAGDSPSTALYKAMGLQTLPAAFSHALSNPSPLLLETPGGQDGYPRAPWLGQHDMQAQMRSPDTYHNPYSQTYQHNIPSSQPTSFYNGIGDNTDTNLDSNRFTPSGVRAPPPDSPGWNASTPSAGVRDSWMQLPMPDLQRPGYPDGPIRWNTAPPNLYSGAYNQGDNEQHSSTYQGSSHQEEFPQHPTYTRAANSMPATTNDSSQFFERTSLPPLMNLRLPEDRKKRKSVDT